MGTMNYQQIFQQHYEGKRVLVTGHTGFKGSWMIAWLHKLGAVVKGYALEPEQADELFDLIEGNKLCDSIIADVCDKRRLQEEIDRFQPDFIFHLAAQALVRLSYDQPVKTFETNVIGTLNVLDAVRQIEKPCVVVIVTTDKVYNNEEWYYPYRETDRLGGRDPYSASKACAELVVSSYRDSFFNPGNFQQHRKCIATARAGNVIGGGDFSKDRIVPDIIRALTKEEDVIVRNPSAVRPWQHVLEPLSGYLLLGCLLHEDHKTYSGAWNFGPYNEKAMTVGELVHTMLKLWGSGSYTIPQISSNLHEAGLLQLDISRSMNILKWKPRLGTEKSIEMVVEEYKELAAGNYEIVFREIETYVSQTDYLYA